MKPPKYHVGQRIYHKSNSAWGRITLVFVSDYEDGRFYEWRYYVDYGGHRWSIPEKYLTTHPKRVADCLGS